MPDTVWMARLRSFVTIGSWPADEGNRPAPRQKKCSHLLQARRLQLYLLLTLLLHSRRPLQLLPTLFLHGRRPLQVLPTLFLHGRRPLQVLPTLFLHGRRPLQVLPTLLLHGRRPLQVLPTLLLHGRRPLQVLPTLLLHGRRPLQVLPTLFLHGRRPLQVLPTLFLHGRRPLQVLPTLFLHGRRPLQVLPTLFLHGRRPLQVLPTLFLHGRRPLQVLPTLLHWDKFRELKATKRQPPLNLSMVDSVDWGGAKKRARRVLDVDQIYTMVTETLTCAKCKASHVSWSQAVLQQLDLAHRYACDVRVIRLLRERGLGNSPTRVLKQLRGRTTQRSGCNGCHGTPGPGLLPVTFPEPPQLDVVPSCKWLLSVYSQDILARLEDIKAHITSTYGSILKMDSTKKITKKLAGTAKRTALWLTSVGNEHGQILISVLTAQEGAGLDRMASDVVKRYEKAGVDPPVAFMRTVDAELRQQRP
ncbi:hypothetical protein CRENBAI_002028 [Crenichthys baileyi]|uniref:DUF6729 domain-containing protein n=1 Tax=Crenichthys baileyi TaxID=28760 RepID=A0AAV9RT30_9TELE